MVCADDLREPVATRASPHPGDGRSRTVPGTARHPVLLPQAGGDREQSATADGTAGGLDAKADLAPNDGLTQRSLGGAVGGFDTLDLQKSP